MPQEDSSLYVSVNGPSSSASLRLLILLSADNIIIIRTYLGNPVTTHYSLGFAIMRTEVANLCRMTAYLKPFHYPNFFLSATVSCCDFFETCHWPGPQNNDTAVYMETDWRWVAPKFQATPVPVPEWKSNAAVVRWFPLLHPSLCNNCYWTPP